MNDVTVMQVNPLIKMELDTQISTARTYPRAVETFTSRVTKLATLDQETAKLCFYTRPIGKDNGKDVFASGPSIRLAEIAVGCWGNIQSGTRIVSVDDKRVIVEGAAWDLENNTRVTKQISRSVWSKKFGTYSEDMITKTINAAQSIALRNAIFTIVPLAYVKQACDQAMIKAAGSVEELPRNVAACLEGFRRHGVEPSKILSYLEIGSANEITMDNLTNLIGIGNALRDKELTVDQVFNSQDDVIVDMDQKERLEHVLSLKKG